MNHGLRALTRPVLKSAAACFLAALLAAGCAGGQALSGASEADRFERVNRAVYQFNRSFDRALLEPVARGYDKVIPQPVERRFRNIFANLRAPIDIVNNALQGKLVVSLSELGRFLVNSTVGLGGLFDPAAQLGLQRHPEDFGQTFAVWGIPAGSYVVLPFLGPRTIRDAIGLEYYGDLLLLYDDSSLRTKLFVWRFISDRAALLAAERPLAEAYDEYVFVREAYIQARRFQIYDGNPAQTEDEYLLGDPMVAP